MKKTLCLLLSLLMLGALMFGCTNAESTGTTAGTTAGTTTGTTAGTTAGTTTGTESGKLDYINYDSEKPIVKEGHDVTLKILYGTAAVDTIAPSDDMWLFTHYKKTLGINTEVEFVASAATQERMSLKLATNDIPDLMISTGINTAWQAQYGMKEGILLDFSPYFEEYMPNWTSLVDEYPMALKSVQMLNGGVYTFPMVLGDKNQGSVRTWQILKEAYEKVGYTEETLPTTLEDLEKLARELKENDPSCVPFAFADLADGGRIDGILLTTYGYVKEGGYNHPTQPHVRNGQVEIPANNDEIMLDIITRMKTYYDEGLISQDYYTMPREEYHSMISSHTGIMHYYSVWTAYSGEEPVEDYSIFGPITTTFNSTPMVPAINSSINGGAWVASAETEYPEVIARLADTYFIEDESVLLYRFGPLTGSEYDYGIWSWHIAETQDGTGYEAIQDIPESLVTKYTDSDGTIRSAKNDYCIPANIPVGRNFIGPKSGGIMADGTTHLMYLAGLIDKAPTTVEEANVSAKDIHMQSGYERAFYPYMQIGYPLYALYTDEQAEKITDLNSVLENYVRGEMAKFVTGVRPLSEFGNFQSELDQMGIAELEQIYKDAYAAYNAS